MPVMLTREAEQEWLNGADVEELNELLRPYPDDELRAYPISKRINNPQNDSAGLIEEIDIGEQSGLGEFGA